MTLLVAQESANFAFVGNDPESHAPSEWKDQDSVVIRPKDLGRHECKQIRTDVYTRMRHNILDANLVFCSK